MTLVDLPKRVWTDVRDAGRLAGEMDRSRWTAVGLGAAAVGLCAAWDEDIRDEAQERTDSFYDGFKPLGDAGYSAGFFAACYSAGRLGRCRRLAETGSVGLEALCLTAVPTLLVQGLTGRARPEDGGGYNWFRLLRLLLEQWRSPSATCFFGQAQSYPSCTSNARDSITFQAQPLVM